MSQDNKIKIVLKTPEEKETISVQDLVYEMKKMSSIFSLIVAICILAGAIIPAFVHHAQKRDSMVSATIKLSYDVPNPEYNELLPSEESKEEIPEKIPVFSILTPAGDPMDPNDIKSPAILRKALEKTGLTDIPLEGLRQNIIIKKIVTEDTDKELKRLQSLLKSKRPDAYKEMQDVEVAYQPKFTVYIKNGFGVTESAKKITLTNEKMVIILQAILEEYNASFAEKWADKRLPNQNKIDINLNEMDVPDALEQLERYVSDLYTYCDNQTSEVKKYKSWNSGRTLENWMEDLSVIKDINLNRLKTYITHNGITKNKKEAEIALQYKTRILESELDEVRETIAGNEELLMNYKNPEIIISQTAERERTAQHNTEYYNEIVLGQVDLFDEEKSITLQLSSIENKRGLLQDTPDDVIANTGEEIKELCEKTEKLKESITNHMEEMYESPLYTTWIMYGSPKVTEAAGVPFSSILIGIAAGAIVGMLMWMACAYLRAMNARRAKEGQK